MSEKQINSEEEVWEARLWDVNAAFVSEGVLEACTCHLEELDYPEGRCFHCLFTAARQALSQALLWAIREQRLGSDGAQEGATVMLAARPSEEPSEEPGLPFILALRAFGVLSDPAEPWLRPDFGSYDDAVAAGKLKEIRH